VAVATTFFMAIAAAAPAVRSQTRGDTVTPRARQIHEAAIVIDGHADTTQRWVSNRAFDIGTRHTDGAVDLPRMRDGGLDALFFSVWMPGTVTGRVAVARALTQIEYIRHAARTHPDELILATTAADVR